MTKRTDEEIRISQERRRSSSTTPVPNENKYSEQKRRENKHKDKKYED